MRTLERGMFGEALEGYFIRLERMRPTVESLLWAFLLLTFAMPAAFAFVSVISCVTRTGRPALRSPSKACGDVTWSKRRSRPTGQCEVSRCVYRCRLDLPRVPDVGR